MAFQITVKTCRGARPQKHICDLPSINAAFAFAFACWPRAVAVAVKPVRIIQLNQEAQ